MVVAKSQNPTHQAESSRGNPPALPPQVRMLQMANAYRVSQAIHVAAKLGVADVLADGAKSIRHIAQETQTHPQFLYRLLRALASMGIFAETETGNFELTPRAALLQSRVPGSLKEYAIVIGEAWHWNTWGEILHSVQTGEPAFDHFYHSEFADYLEQHPEQKQTFERSMVSLLETIDATVMKAYDFSAASTIVEIGIPGSHGGLLVRILQANPLARGIFFDTASNLPQTQRILSEQSLLDRCQLAPGEVFEKVPEGGDLYILKNFIHDFDDQTASRTLKNFRAVMANTAKLLVVEMLVPPGNTPGLSKIVDIEALLMSAGGYERTEAQYRSLFESVGFNVSNVYSGPSPFSIIELTPA